MAASNNNGDSLKKVLISLPFEPTELLYLKGESADV